MPITTISAAIALILLFFYIAFIYNMLASLKNRFEDAFAQVAVQLRHRHELLPKLIETSKSVLPQEGETLENLAQARNAALANLKTSVIQPSSNEAIRRLQGSESKLRDTLGKLQQAIAASRTELEDNHSLLQLQQQLTEAEHRIAFSLQTFNHAIEAHNRYRQRFPANIISSIFGPRVQLQPVDYAANPEPSEVAHSAA